MGPPPGRRWWHGLSDPRVHLKLVMLVAGGGLIGLPLLADAVSGLRHAASGTGCAVINVVDGDTVGLWCGGGGVERARLTGFDAPELFSPRCVSELVAAQRATWALRWMIFRAAKVSVVLEGRDRYDRRLASLFIDGAPASRLMIRAGHARAYDGGKRAGWCG